MERYYVGIVIPAFNEEETIEEVIYKSLRYGYPLVVNDGSSDNTSNLAAKAGAEVINHKYNRGYDEALNTGLKYLLKSNFKYVITIDADNQHEFKTIPEMIKNANKGYDIVITNRYKKQRIGEKVFGLYTNLRWGIKDPLCGLKLYRKKSITGININFESSVGTQVLIDALLKKMRIKEINTKTYERNDRSRFGLFIKGNLKIFKALFIAIKKDLEQIKYRN